MPPAPPAKFARTSMEGWSRKRSVSPNARAARVSPYKKNPAPSSSSSSSSSTASSSTAPLQSHLGLETFVPRRSDDGYYYEDEYRDEHIAYLLKMENATLPQPELMGTQPEVQWRMRPYLIDFLVELHNQWHLESECLYLAINIVDRYVSRRVVFKKHYQLVGCAALWIAAKFEDSKDRVPLVREFYDMCCNSYEPSAFIQMEGHILTTIGWVIGHPTAVSWLRLHLTHSNSQLNEHPRVAAAARFICEFALYQQEFIGIRPSILAWGSLTLARFICGRQRRSAPHELLEPSEPQAIRIAQALDRILHENLEGMSDVLVNKYTRERYHMCAEFVREFYLSGRRYSCAVDIRRSQPLLHVPSTPGLSPPSWSSRRSSALTNSPGSRSSHDASSDSGDEGSVPVTPSSEHPPTSTMDRYVVAAKENIAPSAVKLSKQVPAAPPTPTSYERTGPPTQPIPAPLRADARRSRD